MATRKVDGDFGTLSQFVRLIVVLVNICGGIFAAEEGHGPEDINFVTEEGESAAEEEELARTLCSQTAIFFDITLRGKRTPQPPRDFEK